LIENENKNQTIDTIIKEDPVEIYHHPLVELNEILEPKGDIVSEEGQEIKIGNTEGNEIIKINNSSSFRSISLTSLCAFQLNGCSNHIPLVSPH
jgi:hypothetical protein